MKKTSGKDMMVGFSRNYVLMCYWEIVRDRFISNDFRHMYACQRDPAGVSVRHFRPLFIYYQEKAGTAPVFFVREGDSMAQEFSKVFYKSAAWKKCRESYYRSKGGLCEECLRHGIIRPGEEVHHIEELTPDNINDPATTLNWNNLCLLCHDCHMKRHAKHEKRYKIDKNTGAVVF